MGIETSCDDTAIGIIQIPSDVLANVIHSQSHLSVKFGGVIPQAASLMHDQNLPIAFEEALDQAKIRISDISAIGITNGPGLAPCLKSGLTFAKRICLENDLPLIPVHHMKAHALTSLLTDKNLKFPFLSVLMSGGHALICLARDIDDFSILGETLDTAPGEVIDKVGRYLGVNKLLNERYSNFCYGYSLERIAIEHSTGLSPRFNATRRSKRDCDMAFSGIISAVAKRCEDLGGIQNLKVSQIADISLSFQQLICSVISKRVARALLFLKNNPDFVSPDAARINSIALSGGVAANSFLRESLNLLADQFSNDFYPIGFSTPDVRLCTDNGVMIAWNALLEYNRNPSFRIRLEDVDFSPRVPMGRDCRQLVRDANIKVDNLQLAPVFESVIKKQKTSM